MHGDPHRLLQADFEEGDELAIEARINDLYEALSQVDQSQWEYLGLDQLKRFIRLHNSVGSTLGNAIADLASQQVRTKDDTCSTD